MKYISFLIIVLLMISCTSTKKAVETQHEVVTEVETHQQTPQADEKLNKPTTITETKETQSVEISLGEDGSVDNDSVSETTEIIYTEAFDHAIFNTLLKKHVSDLGEVNYKSFKTDSKDLREYINLLKAQQPKDDWSKNDILAYWINAYNALTIDLIVRNMPVKSIKDIKDPWDQRLWKFGDKWQNLNDIEHKILREMDEPRIHFAIVCASESCPKLQNEAFIASNLDEQLTNATEEFLSDTSKNEISENNLKLSKIFKWFKKDFEQNGSLIDFLNEYSNVSISNNAKKSFKDYSWELNN